MSAIAGGTTSPRIAGRTPPRTRTAAIAVRRVMSHGMQSLCVGCSLAVIALLFLVAGYLFWLGWPGLSLGLFLHDPTGDVANPGGLRHAIVGSAALLGLASLVGVPMGVLTGVYLSEYSAGSWLAKPTRFIADVLAGVPSIVVGILGYELLVVPLGGYNGWAGAVALGFIMVPIVARTTEEMLRLVPDSYRAGSLALGATKSQTITRVVLPAATGSVVTGIMLAIARVAGETAPLLFTALGSRMLTLNPSQPFPSLTMQVYQYVTGPYAEQKKVGWAGILVLIGLLLVLNLTIRLAASRAASSRR